VRGGYVYDNGPINDQYMDTIVPMNNRHIANIGVGYQQNAWGVDLSYSHIFGQNMFGSNNDPASGGALMAYTNGSSEMFGISLKYKFN